MKDVSAGGGVQESDGTEGAGWGAVATVGEYDPVKFVRHPQGQAAFVRRVCEGGCGAMFEFHPLPGLKRLQPCVACGRRTYWRAVAV